MACPGDCAARGCRPFDIWHLVPCQGAHHSERGDSPDSPPPSIGCFAKTNCARCRNHSSWKCPTSYLLTDLRTNKWLSDEVVLRYWRTRQDGSAACRYRD